MQSFPPAMSTDEFGELSRYIYVRSGIHFHAGKKYFLESRLALRLVELGLHDFRHYIAFLNTGSGTENEFREMMSVITVNETSFFRDARQLEILESTVLPDLLNARSDCRHIRIWSAACSSGEEPYTVAILLHRTLGRRLPDWRVEILATDVSERVIHLARRARYTPYTLRHTDPEVIHRYFSSDHTHFQLCDEIRSMVTFKWHNLRDFNRLDHLGSYDIILCRNLFIYFDDVMRQRCVSGFESVLAPDGHLFLGHSENLRGLRTHLQPSSTPNAFAYRRHQPLAA